MGEFLIMTLTPPGYPDPSLAIAGCRAGAVGVLNLEYPGEIREAQDSLKRLATFAKSDFGLKVDSSNLDFLEAVTAHLPPNLRFLILSPKSPHNLEQSLEMLSARGLEILLECTSLEEAQLAEQKNLVGVIAKGCEAGGRIGHETTFILLQRLVKHLSLPVYAQGGIGLHTAAACYAAGAAGVVLDAQLALTRESPVPAALKNLIRGMDGSETICLGEEFGEVHRLISRIGMPVIKELQEIEEKSPTASAGPENVRIWRQTLASHVGWQSQERHLLLWGQDIALASPLAEKYVTVGGILQALRRSLAEHGRAAHLTRPLAAESPLAQAHGTRFPIVQGPMARVSDTPAFALEVAKGGALPFVAAAWMRGPELQRLLAETRDLLSDQPWGVGLLGFLEPDHYRQQMEVVLAQRPPFALIAGGHPEQVKALEQEGIITYVHVPSPGLLRMFLDRGIRRFVLEGRESGGHIGPLCSFVLWELALDQLLKSMETQSQLPECQVLFAGGIHDSLSAAMVAVMAAPLAEKGVRIGIQLGSAYLFTQEAVTTGALAPAYQQEAIRGDHTTVLTSGPGHAERCLDTPFARTFQREKQQLRLEGASPEKLRQALEKMKLGRLRMAAKGVARNPGHMIDPQQPEMLLLSDQEQYDQGIYLIGQLAALRDQAVTIASLHHDLAVEGTRRIAALHPHPVIPADHPEELPSDVAVIGMACLLPQADSPSAFWENILNKVDTLREIPSARWDWRLYYDEDRRAPDKICSKWGAFLDDIPFDPTRYGITPNSLPSIESLQLLALEVSRRALEDAGYAQRPFARSRTSVILGISGSGELAQLYSFRTALPTFFGDGARDLLKRFEGFLPEWTEDSFPGILMNVAAGRIANRFDLGGLNCTVDAACASSLAAVYLAVRELETHTSDLVIVGGGDCMQNPFTYTCFSKTHALSSSGRSQALDAGADGIALGEGVVVLILKRLAEAERDGDRIYAVIKSVAASSDGRGKSLTAPGQEGQVRVLTRAYRKAGFSPATVGLIEAHATGTAVGDRTEIEALNQVFLEAGAGKQSCALGSVKSMIGHTKAAAGLASLMKTALALHHKVLPPTLGVEKPNPALCLPVAPLYVNTEMHPWIRSPQANPRRAGVSALGFGGTNFHVVLEEYSGDYLEKLRAAPFQKGPGELLLWQGNSRQELLDAINSLEDVLRQETPFSLPDLAYTLAGRFEHAAAKNPEAGLRLAVVAASLDDLRQKLLQAREALQGSQPTLLDPRGLYFTDQPLGAGGKLAFLFPGQGSQYLEMFADLAVQFPEFREELEKADRVLAARLPQPLSSFIFPPPAFSEEEKRERRQALVQTTVAQPALGAVNLAMYKFLTHLGILPEMLAGHSYGEYVALAAAGVFEEEDLLTLSEARARFILEEAAGDPGAMAAVHADVQRVTACLEGLADVWIANVNAPAQTVITGTGQAVAEALRRFQTQGLRARLIPVSCAFHSPLVASAAKRLEEFLSALNIHPPNIKVFSNTTTAPYPANPQAIVRQLVEHQVNQVQFVQEIEAMHADGARIFVEVGPGRVLTGLVDQILGERPHLALASNQAGRSGLLQLLHLLGQLSVQGVHCKLDRLYQGRSVRSVDLKHPGKKAQEKQLSATTWLVNGARAKPLRETAAPSSQSAVVLPDLPLPVSRETRLAGGEALEMAGMRPADARRHARATPSTPPAPGNPISSSSGPAAGSPAGHDQVMVQYQRLSQHFLETQKRVMLSYLGGSGTRLPISEVQVPQPSFSEQAAPAAGDIAPTTATPETSGVQPYPPRQALADGLLEIVGARTGYPLEMLDLNLDLEADLGIDSIKRMEILGHFLQGLFPPESDGPPAELAELATIKTLGGIIDRVEACREKAGPGATEILSPPAPPISSVAPVLPQTEDVLPRFTLAAIPAPEPARSMRLAPGRVVVITDDGRGVAAALQEKLQQRGLKTALVRLTDAAAEAAADYSFATVSPPSLALLVETIRQEQGAIGGLVHLLPLRPWTSYDQLDLRGWQERLQEDIGALFLILQLAAPDLKDAAAAGGAWAVAATGLGGHFASDPQGSTGFFPGQGGIPGLLKTVALEWPEVKVKCVDLSPEEPPASLADHLLVEIEAEDELVEVGYRAGLRVTLGLQETSLLAREEPGLKLDSSSVILVTGGARGITAAVTLELARKYRPILIISGRSPAPSDQEEDETAGLTQPQELKAALIAKRQRQGQDPKLQEVEADYLNLLKEREIRANLAALRTAGATVTYLQVDVRDPIAFGDLLDQISSRYGRLDGVIHGAGIIEDKLLRNKSWESFQRVFGTKTESAFILSRKLRPETLQFLVFFSSVAGRFGSRGQADYTAANEVYNKLAAYLDGQWPGRVVAINWGPWKTAGMVSPEVQRQFEERGVGLIEPAAGARIFDLELHRGRKGEAEVVIGDGPWRPRALPDTPNAPIIPSLPLFQHLTTCRQTDGLLTIVRRLDPDHDLYLKDHRLDFKPVLPAAMAMEFMAEAARLALPKWRVVGLKEVRVLKGVVLEDGFRDLQVQVGLPSTLNDPLELEVTLKDPGRPEIPFYQGTVVLSRTPLSPGRHLLPAAEDFQPFGLSAPEAYRRLTFHGPLFQGIQSIQGISEKGMLTTLTSSSPQSCLAGNPAGEWLMDPIVVDCGLQLGLLWWRTYLDITPLPTSFQEIWLYQPLHLAPTLHCYYEVLRMIGQQTMYANIYYWGPDNQLLALIKGFESTGSKALNRLAGSHLLSRANDG